MPATATQHAAGWPPNDGPEAIESDVNAILTSFELQRIRRFYWQVHWIEESKLAEAADLAEPGLKLENVAAHSWHVADACLLLAPRFAELDIGRCAMLAVVHDKLEMITGDYDPVGRDGRGGGSHAFDPAAGAAKDRAERDALDRYLSILVGKSAGLQRELLEETLIGSTREAKFVKAVDKIQALAFVYAKKSGDMSTEHLAFSVRYSRKALKYFPELRLHYECLLDKVIAQASDSRRVSAQDLANELFSSYWHYLSGGS